jgi:hypothetical protein
VRQKVRPLVKMGAAYGAPLGVGWACVLWTASASATDLGDVGGKPVQLDVTETSVAAQHFDARGAERLQDSGWGEWINRLNAAARWGKWTAGLRLDSAVYWRRPVDNPDFASLPSGGMNGMTALNFDNVSRFQNGIYPAKLWLTYASPGIEVTVGDAYVQFGRGLTLSMRKIDELGIDTTLRGAKVEIQKDPFALTVVAGFANPNRIDDATGRSLFPTTDPSPIPVFSSDRIVGAEIQAGRGLPVTLATHVVRYSRCAPYHYDAGGNIVTDPLQDPGGVALGSCDPTDTSEWLNSLPTVPPLLRAKDITMAGQSLEIPTLGGHGKLYLEAAVQQSTYAPGKEAPSAQLDLTGNALYGSLSLDAGPVTSTLEVKSNRNFYPVAAGVDLDHAVEFNVVTYSFAPPAETPTILDTEFGYFNACVDGGRLRTNVNTSDNLLLYGQGIFAYTKSEQTAGGCDARGHTIPSGLTAAMVQDTVWDGLAGAEWYFNNKFSHVFASTGLREDTLSAGGAYYQEMHLEYSIVKYLGGAFSIEAQGFHRLRKEQGQNLDVTNVAQWWHEGENYLALKIAPSWVFAQGFEYTSLLGQPTLYFNGSVLYKFASGSNVRAFVGQQRAAFRCASGVCRYFPPFEGARVELTLRF